MIPLIRSVCSEERRDSSISFINVSDTGLSAVGKSVIGSRPLTLWPVVLEGPLTSMAGSACDLTGESLRCRDFAGLRVVGVEGPEDCSLGGLVRQEEAADASAPLFRPDPWSGLSVLAPPPFC